LKIAAGEEEGCGSRGKGWRLRRERGQYRKCDRINERGGGLVMSGTKKEKKDALIGIQGAVRSAGLVEQKGVEG